MLRVQSRFQSLSLSQVVAVEGRIGRYNWCWVPTGREYLADMSIQTPRPENEMKCDLVGEMWVQWGKDGYS